MRFNFRPGTLKEINRESGFWIFVDVGFSSRDKSCGILIEEQMPRTMQFGCLAERLINEVTTPGPPINLLLEAPLSIAFDQRGNPARRSTDIEIGNERTEYRDWWYNAGAATLLATGHLLRLVEDCVIQREVRLYEGFASFKSSRTPWDRIEKFSKDDWPHVEDLLRLQCAAFGERQDFVTGPNGLQMEAGDCLQSAFKFAGMDFGVPPVVKACKCGQDQMSKHLVWC